MTTLVVEPFGGMAGDMFLAALLDLGDPRFALADLEQMVAALLPGSCELATTEVRRGTQRATLLEVRTPETGEIPHRGPAELLAIVDGAELDPEVKARVAAMIGALGEAEARVHGIPLERVHFHEVGAVDTLVDLAGAAFALHRLGVERVVSAAPLAGSGTVGGAHGTLPVPTPATAELMRGRPLLLGGGPGERLTPTGAVLLTCLTEPLGPLTTGGALALDVAAVGYGAGLRDPEQGPPNLVRVQLGAPSTAGTNTAQVVELTFNLDDSTGEEIGFCLDALRRAGALEAWTVPVQMKKDRPGVVVTALCRAGDRAALERAAFDHTPTLGVRWRAWERTECGREELTVELGGESVRVKRRLRPGVAPATPVSPADLSPEHDDLARLARATGRPLRELEREAVDLALAALGRPLS